MELREEMINGFNVIHGGIIFRLLIAHLLLPATTAIIYQWH
jgi:hypothetical protein